ncbi:heavy metal-responsive transcriptional regulator [Mycobacterium sp. OTB74]|uniref:heavy metal-responsive transcriptional regulator n=1 Tax=Mycobacterium sp. OTB74 TaxID=1853452 RepID=UPI0024750526|nr:heavy metal-responsive transcriptional regulator [Mycobacterium sp. OTB74]MDH6244025.1 DNA-binding transcriptional MerR regulator [Mycobacterium sp. OTB74]
MKIGELAQLGATTAKTIRFYEQEGLLPEPARTASGYRDYDPQTVDRLNFIARAQAAGLSLREVRQVLAIADRGEQPCGHVVQVLAERLDQVQARITELQGLEQHLSALLDYARQATPREEAEVCWILESNPAATAAPSV